MLSYQDVVTIKLGALTTAATDWDDMAGGFEELETLYKGKVEAVATDGGWVGVSAGAAASQFSDTAAQFADAQTESRAIASILRDAHQQFSKLIAHVKDVVEQAAKDEMSVNSKGEAVYDFSKLTPMRHDEDYPKYVSQAKSAEAAWTKKIKDAVQAVDDADQGVKLALHEAAGIKSWAERLLDPFGGQAHTFNGSAIGDIEVYEAREAKQYANEILDGQKLQGDDLKEWQRLMRDNSGDKVFSQTFLDSLGPDKTLKLTNRIDDLAYFDDIKDKNAYLQINGGISDSLATATRVPDFTDANGKHLRFGTTAYNQAFNAWTKTDDAQFYNQWREALRERGDDEYALKAAGDKVGEQFKGYGQKVRGYQSLATLMQQGHGYSPQFVADVTDDMISMEKKNPDVWDLYGHFDKKDGDGWFANDPVDGALEVMSHNPEGAAGYLDPGTAAGKERSDYLLGNGDGSRDWNITNTTRWEGPGGNIEVNAGDVADSDSRNGLGDALTSAATGVDPNGSRPLGPTHHTGANDRVFVHALDVLSGQGDNMPASLRDDMAKIMTNHGHEVYVAMSDPSEQRHPDHGPTLDAKQVMEMTKQISRSEHSYGLLHQGMNYAIMDDIHDRSRKPEDTLTSSGYAVGFMEEARYNALKGDQHDYTWDKAWSYHASGALLNFIPVYGDIAQRGADVVTSAWIMDEQQHQADKLTSDNQATYDLRRNQLNSIAQQWYTVNSDWASSPNHPGYSYDDGVYKQIAAAANDGNKLADGTAGDQ
ncbi:hypothetical protein [Streptomyces mirabilis]|uniref:hypothetical protein n=1 Tax=Streptomyces mirabilis TaxID=68239 RepID=UPI0036EFAFE1